MQVREIIENLKQKKYIFLILVIVVFCVIAFIYGRNIAQTIRRSNFEKQMITIAEENLNPIFSIDKIILYSNADAIDNSKQQNLQDIDIYQYTDIAIYINNKNNIQELTQENTVSELIIDEIEMEPTFEIGEKSLNYKNPSSFSKFSVPQSLNTNNDPIKFNIVHTNEQNQASDYNNPTFFTDCSNPITLGYINKNIVTNYKVLGEKNTISFNGKVLQEANVDLSEMNYTLSFKIRLKNNLGESFVYAESFDVKLDDETGGLYKGFVLKARQTNDKDYNFLKIAKEKS